jgi:hypothetical protein
MRIFAVLQEDSPPHAGNALVVTRGKKHSCSDTLARRRSQEGKNTLAGFLFQEDRTKRNGTRRQETYQFSPSALHTLCGVVVNRLLTYGAYVFTYAGHAKTCEITSLPMSFALSVFSACYLVAIVVGSCLNPPTGSALHQASRKLLRS